MAFSRQGHWARTVSEAIPARYGICPPWREKKELCRSCQIAVYSENNFNLKRWFPKEKKTSDIKFQNTC